MANNTRSVSRTKSSSSVSSPRVNPSPLRTTTTKPMGLDDHSWMDDKLRQQNEFIVKLLSQKLEESEKRITEELGREIKDY